MSEMQPFDLLTCPLAKTNLIEAGAGTGKTYAITGLLLRLILEKNFSIDQILVVTFTEAATQELKNRIRFQIREAIEAFSKGESEDGFLDGLVRGRSDSAGALKHLKEALRDFDEASIFTIHGFCRKMLYENAFESGSLFESELVIAQEDLKREIVEDFWRKHFYKASPLFISHVINNRINPNNLLALLGDKLDRPYLRVIPQVEISDSTAQELAFRKCFKETRRIWQSTKNEVEDILTNDAGLNRNRYRKANISGWCRRMERFMMSEENNSILFKGFEKFTLTELKKAVKQKQTPLFHPFFKQCEILLEKQRQLQTVFEERLLGLKKKLFFYLRDELARRKEEKNILFFDDLLLKLYWALEGEGGQSLVTVMRSKFKAALIDEFQDTDPIQYAIFKKVFGTGHSILFLIGDPKQAIYSFRNADIFAYMEAAESFNSRYTLKENWRSEPDLVDAINTIFSFSEHPFVYDKIPFQPATPTLKKDSEFLKTQADSEAPFRLWFMDAGKITKQGKPLSKTQARKLIPRAVAAEISRLLSLSKENKITLLNRPLREEDIAVLVRKNTEARLIQEALFELNIPGVLHTTGNIFDSHEALEVERVLAGIAKPNQERFLLAALTTDMLGVKGESLDRMIKDETRWEALLLKFKLYHDLWSRKGFIRMFRQLLLTEKVLTRLMLLPDGERRNTNVLHLSEILHQASVSKKLGIAGLIQWLSGQRDPDTERLEEYQLRLESDTNAVKIVTTHKGKGLEYPVVFCPFAWDGSRVGNNKNPFVFHDPDDNMKPTLDLGSVDMNKHRLFAEKELLSENLRLLYVALTRAKNRCYFVWGRFNEAEASAPAYLFHTPECRENDKTVDAVEQRFVDLSDKELFADLKKVRDKSGGGIMLSEIPMEIGKAYTPPVAGSVRPVCRNFSGKIDNSWRVSSFSSMVSGMYQTSDPADRDPTRLSKRYDPILAEELSSEDDPWGIFSFPGGTRAGLLMHDLLEHLDFTWEADAIKELVDDKLQDYGFEPLWQETLCTMIKKVLCIPLDGSRKDFTLSRIENKNRLNELQFYFPLKSISPKILEVLFLNYGEIPALSDFPEHMKRLNFAPAKGFIKGFIDMVFQFEGRFFLVDWKSNLLGKRVADYDQKALKRVMEEDYYILQYHLYVIALNQYLRLRFPGYDYRKHFGGVYYIFMRGVDPDMGPEFGIFRDKPTAELIDKLSESLIH